MANESDLLDCGIGVHGVDQRSQRRARLPRDLAVVLIGADSIDTIRQTHSHYFGELHSNPFEELL